MKSDTMPGEGVSADATEHEGVSADATEHEGVSADVSGESELADILNIMFCLIFSFSFSYLSKSL